MDVQLLSYSKYHNDVIVTEENGTKVWRYTRFYGKPCVSKKNESWNLLRRLGADMSYPWLISGDFNEILYSF